jgi:hypothetical protein
MTNVLQHVRSSCQIILCSLLLGLMVACSGSSTPDIDDGGFLSGEPCGPPCFRGIIPGDTTEVETMQIFQRDRLCETNRVYDQEASGGTRGIFCTSSGLDTAFKPGANTVDAISFKPSRRITVEEVIARYGEPVAVLVSGRRHEPRTNMVLYYDSIQASLSFLEQEGITFEIKSSTEVERILYCDPVSCINYRPVFLQEWKGYGEYQEHSPSE